MIYAFVWFSFPSSERRSDVVLEEKPESSLVKNVSFAGHVNKEKIHPDTPVDAPQQGQHCTSYNANGSSLDCSWSIARPVKCNRCDKRDKEVDFMRRFFYHFVILFILLTIFPFRHAW